ncbi:uncharacterized protein BDZ99DRAFT_465657 [Mytilinidion resinicola]|uniref:Uncharacterized protein n=1 Tax=Mytilinidion resinicola TaxID=574789 RepID=A0A6A6YDJ6_9PEZI|nr:uncharacterized protein BDZ99DRAFT_465657 [Mytilinidion resinicola]KAF2806901.1 hypothetical protein BDZ99DRAFT_465657 [Mytilinidion resinicola]
MSDLDPQGSSQPTSNEAYTTPGNPAGKDPVEKRQAAQNARSNPGSDDVEHVRSQGHSQEEGTFSSLGRGVRGGGDGEVGKTEEQVGRHNELDAEQMAVPGEGRIRDAVAGNSTFQGRSGEQEDLASDLDRKKAEQAPLRGEIKEDRAKGIDVGGILGQSGGPASTVD